ncbi:MAG: hypothetical protein KDC54_24555 [Lewinella sp.]|nr:hypothetical protein [Lewinella sp.]
MSVQHLIHFAHIINPVALPAGHELMVAQPITFASMRLAQAEARAEGMTVKLLTTQFPEDQGVIPADFTILPDLTRSVLDTGPFQRPRKLPLIADILDRLEEHAEAPYLIFTNVDIGLQPHFYRRVAEWLARGHDALIINRRRLPARYTSPAELPAIFADPGRPHPGFDCFVFHRRLFPYFRLDEICVGVPFIGVTLAHHLFAFAENCRLIGDEQLTFHLGQEVMPPRDPEYYWHNRRCFRRIRDEHLWPHLSAARLPYAERPWPLRWWKWIRNPSLFIRMNLLLSLRAHWPTLAEWLWQIRRKKGRPEAVRTDS